MEMILSHAAKVSLRNLSFQRPTTGGTVQRGVVAPQGVRRRVRAHASSQGNGSKGLGLGGVSSPGGSPNGGGNVPMALNGVGLKTSDAIPPLQKTMDGKEVWGWSKDVGLVSGMEEGARWEGGMVSDSSDEEAAVVEETDRPLPDQDLETITENMLSIERGVKQMNEFTRMLSDTAKALSARAQANRIEAAKIRKMWAMQQAEGVRHAQELRKAMDLRRAEEKRLESIRGEQAQLQQALEEAKVTMDILAPSLSIPTPSPEVPSPSPSSEKDPPPSPTSATGTPLPPSAASRLAPTAASSAPAAAPELEDGLGPGAVALPEALECTISHPGALSCTKTTIRKDAAQKSASVTMTVTTRCEGDACLSTSLDVEDYVALSVQSLVDVAHELKHTRFKQRATDADPVVHEKHRSIVEVLKRGKVVSSKPNEPPSKFGHESFVVKLLDPKTNQKVETMFKPRVEGDADGWHRAPVEWVAYELNLMLGMDYVPPVFYRKGGINLLDDRHFEEGAVIYYVRNTKPLKRVPAAGWGISVARLLSDTRILDVLLNNSDRHHGHFLYGEHWVDGKLRPVLIDHAAGFRKEAVVAMDHENAFQTGPVRCVSSRTYLRLRFLERETVAAKFSGVLSSDEINALMRRRDKILAYLDNLVQERGYHRTVIEL